ncbi:helix-turn-helix domain-containing protein [Desertibacillus haloalkaliphilus]|uniref:helix-turn-helix domain-containing protein n=1 Tax=Desertibacillus haloalkaliphilus TaxID=1328930 RepID=UPI001C273BF7|nr:helix-turn-helix domain-containing protein [Desertibacillus haloalkaliphilus]MBU8906321.1 helix-turn-helix domain-containing protein [Desertibacillus haloalkaliphilus]
MDNKYQEKLEGLLRQKNKEISLLMAGIRDITSSLDKEYVLTQIIKNALTVIPNGETGFLMLYDPSIERLVPKTAVGFNQKINHFTTKIGEGITGKVFEDGKARIYDTNSKIYQDMSNLSKENFDILHASLSDHFNIRTAIGVPVSVNKERIGVLVVHQFNSVCKLSMDDVKILQGFADQAAIAIQNARLYSEVKVRLHEITKLSEQLREKNEFLQKRNKIHETLTEFSLKNQGVENIINEISRMIDSDVYFMSYLENDYYPMKIRKRPPLSINEIMLISVGDKKSKYFDVFEEGNSESYYVYPIVNGSIFLGSFIVSNHPPLSKLAKVTIEQGAALLALELIRKQTLTEIQYKKTREFFNDILENKDEDYLQQKGNELGLNVSDYLFCVIFQTPQQDDVQKLETTMHRLISMIKKIMSNVDFVIYATNNQVVLLLSTSHPDTHKVVRNNLDMFVKDWITVEKTPCQIGIGNLYKGIIHVKKSYREAEKALTYLVSHKKSGVMFYKDMGLNRLFLNQDSREINVFIQEVFEPLKSEVAKRNELEETLVTYISMNKSVNATAKKLHIHTNTLYQRLRKVEKLLNIDFNNTEDTLKVQLACHMMETFNKST